MIRPTKYLDLDTCVINVAAAIIAELQRTPAIPLDELNEVIAVQISEDAKINFFPALSLLYITGKLDYDDNADAIISLVKRTGTSR
ncbi:MAG: hypothetical protein JO316_25600 [Abitibacteriaceae bacterium]|nr:hypothetical protein [Abditibacteriaceae bacterium]